MSARRDEEWTGPANTLAPRGTVLVHKGEEVVVICHDMTLDNYKVEAIDGRRFWVHVDHVTR